MQAPTTATALFQAGQGRDRTSCGVGGKHRGSDNLVGGPSRADRPFQFLSSYENPDADSAWICAIQLIPYTSVFSKERTCRGLEVAIRPVRRLQNRPELTGFRPDSTRDTKRRARTRVIYRSSTLVYQFHETARFRQ